MWVGGQRHAPAALPPRKETRYSLHRRLGGLQGQSGRVRKTLSTPGFDPRTVQSVGSRKRQQKKLLGFRAPAAAARTALPDGPSECH